MLSHDINKAITTGFAKGTPSSDMVACIRHLKACSSQIAHPMLLPMVIFSHDMSAKTDIKQREARDWLRKLEHAVSMRTEIEENEGYVVNGLVDFDLINRDLVECHSQVLWKRPRAYMIILEGFVEAMTAFEGALPQERREGDSSKELRKLHASMLGRMEFYKRKLQGIDGYAFTTLQRLDIQRSAVRPGSNFPPSSLFPISSSHHFPSLNPSPPTMKLTLSSFTTSSPSANQN
jgi:hypothetical protein